MLQFIWAAVSYLLKLSEWCSGDVLILAHSCSCVCYGKWLQWNVCGASHHLLHLLALSFCLLLQYPIWLHKTLQNKQHSLHCSSSQDCFFLLREISGKVNYQVILVSDRLLEATALFFLPWWSLSIPLLPLNWCHWWDSWEMLLNLHFLIVPSKKKRYYKLF